jgi:hypothetical protein
MINRILFHIISNDPFYVNEYGFNSQRGTVDASMEAKFL